ncbi:DUF4279 domain-containing protein [Catenulispora rubra]|uniref:DUF4279 domain-containing protein n=1 Tax=Catenulispora rubra TaxID=280293 RepID=UPI00189270A5|nr:DUF4279 domain-containing protein [Catenulispora rubra]
MLISQYAYFGLSSPVTSAAEMAAVLGIEPDEISVRGSRWGEPRPRPALHYWKIVCREPAMSVNQQIEHIMERLAPHVDAIAALARQLSAEDDRSGAVLEIVRMFNDDEGQDRLACTPPELIDGHNLLGWHLDRDVLDFLHATRAVLDVDEYDCAEGADDD